ncbi:hypothetical protein GH733_011168 [Mirounga leonina]|nr:hypothetical protein GH733_011168 [Mirounga leonina]
MWLLELIRGGSHRHPGWHHAALGPLVKSEIITKRAKKFIWYQIQGRFGGRFLRPNGGYKSNKKTEYLPSSGFQKFLVHNIEELKVTMMLVCNRAYCMGVLKRFCPRTAKLFWKEQQIAHAATGLELLLKGSALV